MKGQAVSLQRSDPTLLIFSGRIGVLVAVRGGRADAHGPGTGHGAARLLALATRDELPGGGDRQLSAVRSCSNSNSPGYHDAQADLNSATVGYARTFALGSRQGLVAGLLPDVRGDIAGTVFEESRRVERSGLADVRVKVSINLVGTEAMTREEFAKAPRRTIVGASLTVQAPTGQYDETKLINIGTHRWSFKPEVGVSVPLGRP